MKNIIKKLVIGTLLTACTFVTIPSATSTAFAATKVVSNNTNCDFTSGKFKFDITGSNTCTVTGFTNKAVNSTTCKIPSTVTCNGKTYKVTGIANNAFNNNDSIKKVIIPNSVKTIGSKAFYDCNSIKNVSLGNKVSTIKSNAFSNCNKLSNINCSNVITSLGNNCFGNIAVNFCR